MEGIADAEGPFTIYHSLYYMHARDSIRLCPGILPGAPPMRFICRTRMVSGVLGLGIVFSQAWAPEKSKIPPDTRPWPVQPVIILLWMGDPMVWGKVHSILRLGWIRCSWPWPRHQTYVAKTHDIPSIYY